MNNPGSLCPTIKAAEVLGDKWTLLLLRELFFGARRYSEFQRALPRISPTVLSGRLKKMEENGLVVHKKADGQKRGEYRLTASAWELAPIVDSLARWGLRWARDQLCDADLDVGSFMWDFHRTLVTETLPDGRNIIGVIFADQETPKWWVIAEGESIDLCNDDPGYDVDIYLSSNLETMAAIWMGDITPQFAISNGTLLATGRPHLKKSIGRWFPRSRYAEVRPQAENPC